MANLSDFVSASTGAGKVKYVTTAGTYTIVPNDGATNRLFIVSNVGFKESSTSLFWQSLDQYQSLASGLDLTAVVGDGVPMSTVRSSFASPSTNPFGLTFDGTNLISCDSGSGLIYIHDGVASTILSSFAAPSGLQSGLTFDGTNLISCDSISDLIYIHDGVTSTILSSLVSPAGNPSGLTFDGTNLISCDNASDLIYIHGSPLPEYATIQFLTKKV